MNPSTQSVNQDRLVLVAPTAPVANGDIAGGDPAGDETTDEGIDGFSKTFAIEIESLQGGGDDPILRTLQGNRLPQVGKLIPPEEAVIAAFKGAEVASTDVALSTDELATGRQDSKPIRTFELQIDYVEVGRDDPILPITAAQGNRLSQAGNLISPEDGIIAPRKGAEVIIAPLEGAEVIIAPLEGAEVIIAPLEGAEVVIAPRKGAEDAGTDIALSMDAIAAGTEADKSIDVGLANIELQLDQVGKEPVDEESVQPSFTINGVVSSAAEEVGGRADPGSKVEQDRSSRSPIMKALSQMQVLGNNEQTKGELVREQVSRELTVATVAQVPALDLMRTRLAANSNILDGMKSSTDVQLKVGEPGWGEAMVNRISLLVGQRISSARVNLNPPELGPIEIRLNLKQDQVSVQFVSHSAQVREALAQSLPRLSEMLGQMGIDLVEANVSDQPFREHQRGDDNDRSGESAEESSHFDSKEIADTHRLVGLIDFYV